MSWERVLVGIDGSEGSRHALRYAADEARAHDATLAVLLAYRVPPPPVPLGSPASLPWRTDREWREDAERLLRETVRDTLGDRPEVPLSTSVVEDQPVRALLAAAHDDDLLVVGTRGHGGFAGMLLGSVSQHLAAHAPCTVAVVR
jgi:nucleotide-binding universal stress UspA family protein